MQQIQAHIAVIGGGAAGLAAAIEAKRQGGHKCSVAIIEKNSVLGKKIPATGNGRCNLGNALEKQICHYHGSCTVVAEKLLSQYTGSESFFKSLGVICKSDSGRLYPYSNHAASVLDALRFQVQELGAEVYTDFEVVSVKQNKDGKWIISDNIREVTAEKIIIACGGKAAPTFGTDGSFYKIIKTLGHSWKKLSPALCPIKTDPKLLSGLKGIRTQAKVTLFNKNKKLIVSDTGEIQLTDKFLSGICVFNLASYATEDEMYISLDLLPHLNEAQVQELLWEVYAQRSQQCIEDMLTGIFQKKMCSAIFKAANINILLTSPVYNLTPDHIDRLAKTIKNWCFPVKGLSDWNSAQVTCGGISGDEIFPDLKSKLHPDIYFAGEILDIDGECGGYNLAWAWCSGTAAANAAVNSLKGKCEL